MDKRTDTGCMLPGRGDGSPLPEPAGEPSLHQAAVGADDVVARLDGLLRETISRLVMVDSDKEYVASVMSRYAQMGSPAAVASPPVQPPREERVEQPIMTLPYIFIGSVRMDAHRTNLMVDALRSRLAPEASGYGRHLFHWYHIRRVLDQRHLIVQNTNLAEFARGMETVLGDDYKWDNIRHAATELKPPEMPYRDMDDGDPYKEACLRVEEMLGCLITC